MAQKGDPKNTSKVMATAAAVQAAVKSMQEATTAAATAAMCTPAILVPVAKEMEEDLEAPATTQRDSEAPATTLVVAAVT